MAEGSKKSTSGWLAVLKNIVSLTPYWGSVVYIVAIKWQNGPTENNVTFRLITYNFHSVFDRVKGYLVLMVTKSVMSVMKMLF